MNFLRKIDGWLIDRYQGLIDVTQKAPAWWAEQCAFAALIGEVARIVFNDISGPWMWVMLVADVVLCTSFFIASRVPALLSICGEWAGMRMVMLLLQVILTPGYWITHNWSENVVDAIASVAILTFYYVAACKPPRPREPRRKLAGGAA